MKKQRDINIFFSLFFDRIIIICYYIHVYHITLYSMGLNLSSLKNLSTAPVNASGKGKSIPSPIEISREDMPNIFENTTSIPKSIQENDTPATGPKISLMKLKKAS